jgi:hypothetical protein
VERAFGQDKVNTLHVWTNVMSDQKIAIGQIVCGGMQIQFDCAAAHAKAVNKSMPVEVRIESAVQRAR